MFEIQKRRGRCKNCNFLLLLQDVWSKVIKQIIIRLRKTQFSESIKIIPTVAIEFLTDSQTNNKFRMKTQENKLYSYKMARDTRFAPNPLFGVLTLATCKPSLRRNTQVGNWIAGWTSKSIVHNPTEVGEEKLIYLARITKKLTFAEYWVEYPQKRPVYTDDTSILERYGDNIYQPGEAGNFMLIKNINHDESKMEKDLKGKYVLVCEEFYYFSCLKPLIIPIGLRPRLPKAQTSYGVVMEDASGFINYVKQRADLCDKTDAK